MKPPLPSSTPTNDGQVRERVDFSYLLMVQLARVLETPTTRKGERYNRLLELASLLHPYQDAEYADFAKSYFVLRPEERVQRTLRWLSALTDLMNRAGFMGRRDVQE